MRAVLLILACHSCQQKPSEGWLSETQHYTTHCGHTCFLKIRRHRKKWEGRVEGDQIAGAISWHNQEKSYHQPSSYLQAAQMCMTHATYIFYPNKFAVTVQYVQLFLKVLKSCTTWLILRESWNIVCFSVWVKHGGAVTCRGYMRNGTLQCHCIAWAKRACCALNLSLFLYPAI